MKGIYVLVLEILKDVKIKVGAIGIIYFKKGYYAYIGSAQTSIESRVNRHFSKNKKIRWHIDYLLNNVNVKLLKALYKKCRDKSEECKFALKLMENNVFVEKFGCSDCKCKSHLVKITSLDFGNEFLHF